MGDAPFNKTTKNSKKREIITVNQYRRGKRRCFALFVFTKLGFYNSGSYKGQPLTDTRKIFLQVLTRKRWSSERLIDIRGTKLYSINEVLISFR